MQVIFNTSFTLYQNESGACYKISYFPLPIPDKNILIYKSNTYGSTSIFSEKRKKNIFSERGLIFFILMPI